RPLKIETQIAPRRLARSAGKILGGEIPSSRPEFRPVGDHHFTVVAEIPRALRAARKQGAEYLRLDGARCQRLEPGAGQLQGADAIEQQAHFNAAARTLDHELHRFPSEGVVAQNVRANVQAL